MRGAFRLTGTYLFLLQLSTKKTLPAFKLGTGPRFVSPEMREAAGKPAPGSYNIPSTVGKLSDADGVRRDPVPEGKAHLGSLGNQSVLFGLVSAWKDRCVCWAQQP